MNRILLSILLLGVLGFTSCLKKNFDSPPDTSGIDPNLPVNMTLKKLSDTILKTGGMVMWDVTVAGIVTGDDRSGNLYKSIIIQDSTGGITLSLNQVDLYNFFPVGRKVYVKLKGLYGGSYHGTPEIAYSVDATGNMVSIPATLISNYVIKATYPNPVPVTNVTLAQLNSAPGNYINKLVNIDSAEFATADAGQVYAVPATISSGTQRYIENCSGNQVEVYTSGYANFSTYLTPSGKGSFSGIFTVYNGAGQLTLLDTTGVKMYGPRCGGGTVNPGGGSIVSIDSVRKMYNMYGDNFKLGAYKITGVVIATNDSGNLSTGTIVLQNGNKGISVYYGTTPAINYHVGDSLIIDVTGLNVIRYKPGTGSLEIKYGSASNTTVVATNVTVQPQVLTVAQIDNMYLSNDMEYTLVKILNPTIAGGTTYGSKLTITDGSGGAPISFFNQYANFASETVPSNPKSVTGFLTTYNSAPEMQLRGPAIDVVP